MKNLFFAVLMAGTTISGIAKYVPPGPEFYAPNYEVPGGLVRGAAFNDLFLPVPIQSPLRSDLWGTEGVVPRDVTNGIEDPDYSYWGGNMVKGDDGKMHLFVCRWPEAYRGGHGGWHISEVVHAVSDSPMGPFKVKDVIGPGHNPEVYRAKDGTWLIGVMEDIGTYKADHLNGPWEPHMPNFIPINTKPYHLRNRAYSTCEDGSVLMVVKNGTIWHSIDGITDFRQVTKSSVYPPTKPDVKAYYEDPVIWRDEVQFHLIVNDCLRREAFYMRSSDGIHWKMDPGYAYRTDMMVYQDGPKEEWYKWERPKVCLDEFGRATHMNFAVIDVAKKDDKGGDNHSSKNVVLPLVVPRRLEILNSEPITAETKSIRVKVLAESNFDPIEELDLDSLRLGASEVVNFGGGCVVKNHKVQGNDLILTFSGLHGVTEDHFALKMLGSDVQGGLIFGFASLN